MNDFEYYFRVNQLLDCCHKGLICAYWTNSHIFNIKIGDDIDFEKFLKRIVLVSASQKPFSYKITGYLTNLALTKQAKFQFNYKIEE